MVFAKPSRSDTQGFHPSCRSASVMSGRRRMGSSSGNGSETILESEPEVLSMRQDLIGLLESWIPKFEADGRSYLTFSFGCTGGQHRSVYLVERIFSELGEQFGKIVKRHRELE